LRTRRRSSLRRTAAQQPERRIAVSKRLRHLGARTSATCRAGSSGRRR
jgi:hypothetical protein